MVVPNAPVNYPISSAGTQVVSEVLSKLLTVGITDPGKLRVTHLCYYELFLGYNQGGISIKNNQYLMWNVIKEL